MPILFECFPVPDLRVIPVAKILTRACLAPCFLGGMSAKYHTIPHSFRSLQRQHFDGGQTDTAVQSGRGSKLYELNMYAMTLGRGPRGKERTVTLDEELAKRAATKEANVAKAASKQWETWADKRAKSGA